MAKRYIACEDCNHWELVSAKNAKRCYVCRLVNNLNFIRGRKSKCWRCEQPFCPISRDDQLCGNCAFKTSGAEEINCSYCGERKTSVAKDIAVCMGCARDIDCRKRFLSAIERKQERRRAEDPGPQPETRATVTPAELGPDI